MFVYYITLIFLMLLTIPATIKMYQIFYTALSYNTQPSQSWRRGISVTVCVFAPTLENEIISSLNEEMKILK